MNTKKHPTTAVDVATSGITITPAIENLLELFELESPAIIAESLDFALDLAIYHSDISLGTNEKTKLYIVRELYNRITKISLLNQ